MSSAHQLPVRLPPQSDDRTHPLAPATIFWMLAIAEAGLIGALLLDVMTVWFAALSHLALVASAAWAVLRTASDRRATSATGLFATLLTGVFGALGAALLVGWLNSDCSKQHGVDLESWYLRLSGQIEPDRAVDIHADIVAGRAMRRDTTNVPHLESVLDTGELSAKQAILGYIGLNYHPSLLPVILKALASSDAIIRVQAAAVFAKLRETYKSRLRACRAKIASLENTQDAARAIDLSAELHACLRSGFLDPAEQRAAGFAAIELCAPLLAGSRLHEATEQQLCRIVADAGAHELIRQHLAPRASTLDGELASLYIAALMQLGKSRELAETLRFATVGGPGMSIAQPTFKDLTLTASPSRAGPVADDETKVSFHVG